MVTPASTRRSRWAFVAATCLMAAPLAAQAKDDPAPPTVKVGDAYDTGCKAVLPGLSAVSPASVAKAVHHLSAGDDTQIYNNANDCHVFAAPAAGGTAANKLFLFIVGTNGTPAAYQQVLREASSRGYHAVGVSYPNNVAVGAWCNDRPAPTTSPPPASYTNCAEDMRREIILGYSATDPSGKTVDSDGAVVDIPNSIQHRLADFLLAQAQGDATWNQFAPGGKVDWSKVVVAGHSQGSGHALYLAKLFTVSRAVIFSGVSDRATDDTTQVAPWLFRDASWKTPASATYAMVEDGDPVVNGVDPDAGPCYDSPNSNTYPTSDTAVFDHHADHCHFSYEGWFAARVATAGSKGNGFANVVTVYNRPQNAGASTPSPGSLHSATVVDYFSPTYVDSGQVTRYVYAPLWDALAFPAP